MSDVPGSEPPKITEEKEEVIEKEECSQASDQPPRSTPEKSSASTAGTSDPVAKSTPEKSSASDEASKSTPEKPTTPAKGVSEEGPAQAPPVVSVQPPPAESPVVSPPKVGNTPDKKPGILKGLRDAIERTKNLFKRDSPKKQDSVPFVPEASGGVEASANTSTARSPSKTKPAAKTKNLFKRDSPKKHDSVPEASGGVEASANTAAAKTKKPKKERRGSWVVDSPPSGGLTLVTELEASSSADFPSDADRKESIASSDTGAHISMLPNLDDASSGGKGDEMEVDKGDADPETPMEDEQ